MIVDAHQHFWALERGDYGWLTPDLATLYRDYLPHDLEPLLHSAGIAATVAVQAAPTEDETRYLLSLAQTTPFVAGVVGWVDLSAPSAPTRLAELADSGGGYFKGVRPMLQDLDDPAWIASPSLDAAFDALIELDLCFDALVRPIHLPALKARQERHPSLRTVVDHGGKPDIAGGRIAEWRGGLAALAAFPSVYCKLSGLVTEAGPQWTVDTLAPYVDFMLSQFGARRLIWGSDWPVLNLASNYSAWFAAAQTLTGQLSGEQRAYVFATAAAEFYRLGVARTEVSA